MAIAILTPLTYAASPTVGGGPIVDTLVTFVATGDPDAGKCVQAPSDGLSDDGFFFSGSSDGYLGFYWEDTGEIPLTATINSVQFKIRAKLTSPPSVPGSSVAIQYVSDGNFSSYSDTTGLDTLTAAYADINMGALQLVNGFTGLPWTRAELFNDNDAGGLANGFWYFSAVHLLMQNLDTTTLSLDEVMLEVDYTAVGPVIGGVRMDQCPVLVLVPYALAQSNALGVDQGPNIEIEAANVLVPALEDAGIVNTVITPNGGTPGQGGPFPLGPDTPVPAGPNPPSWAIGAVAAPAPALPNTSVPKQWQLLRFDIKPRAEERA